MANNNSNRNDTRKFWWFGRKPVNAPEYFTQQINRCQDQLFELRRISRRPDVTEEFLYQRLNTCGAFYQQLLDVANRDHITWEHYDEQHRNIEMYLTQINENLELKIFQSRLRRARGVPGWLKSLGTLAKIVDTAMDLADLPPMAEKVYQIFVKIVGWFIGKDYMQLMAGSVKYLPVSK